MELLPHTALVRPMLECAAVCWDPCRGQLNAAHRAQKREVKFANNINQLGWEGLAQRRMSARLCALFKAHTGRRTWKAISDRLLKPCQLSRGDHNQKIMTRETKNRCW
jgi:hypothetical protein